MLYRRQEALRGQGERGEAQKLKLKRLKNLVLAYQRRLVSRDGLPHTHLMLDSQAGNVRKCLDQEFEKLAGVEELYETYTSAQTERRPIVSQGGSVGWSILSQAGPGGWSAGSQAGPGRWSTGSQAGPGLQETRVKMVLRNFHPTVGWVDEDRVELMEETIFRSGYPDYRALLTV